MAKCVECGKAGTDGFTTEGEPIHNDHAGRGKWSACPQCGFLYISDMANTNDDTCGFSECTND